MTSELLALRTFGVIRKVMEEGRATHPDDDWPWQPVETHLQHACLHLAEEMPTRSDLEHALTRIAMALQLLDDGAVE